MRFFDRRRGGARRERDLRLVAVALVAVLALVLAAPVAAGVLWHIGLDDASPANGHAEVIAQGVSILVLSSCLRHRRAGERVPLARIRTTG